MGRPVTPYARGYGAELLARKRLVEAGWVVTRRYASKGTYDLMALRDDRMPALVQVKRTRTAAGSPAALLSPGERLDLVAEASKAGAEAVVARYVAGAAGQAGGWAWVALESAALGDARPWTP